ncbi:MAG: hypothetical protein V1767_01950 [Chloroflexota bacterium]
MVWWQGLLVILGFVVAAVPIGLLVGYIILRIQGKPWPLSRSRERGILNVEKVTPQVSPPVSPPIKPPAPPVEFKSKLPTPVVSAAKAPEKPEALKEIEANLVIATAPWNGRPQPFRTEVWDKKSDEFNLLRAGLREELTEAYMDMRLANDLVWLLTDVGRRNKDLDESYIKLCAAVAERLNSLMPSLREASKKSISA